MDEIFRQIFNVDAFTIAVVLVLSTWAAVIIHHMTESTGLAAVFTPIIMLGALVGIAACRQLEVVFTFQKDSNTIISASVGMILTLIFLLLMTRSLNILRSMRKTGLEGRIDRTA